MILNNDQPKTIADQKQLILDANPGFLVDGININPIQKNDQREGTFEVDFFLVPEAGDIIEQLVAQGTKQATDLLKQKDDQIAQLTREKADLEKENQELKKKDTQSK